LFYANDVTSVISEKCKCKLYADDLKLYSEITVASDCRALQVTVDKVKMWSDKWQLSMSLRKCAAMVIVLIALLITSIQLVAIVYL